ncbi:MAG: NAD(P)H-quinone oxidoreductase [Aphanocapsa feldmannii 277cV]|uniref:NAD(P)H-quinone oxidoreductase n=2 Tax=Aphanocapsa feldmannii TaxID=192050 RepID=A0A524RNB3_9CHRO|nr:MAG: NAD(P)H-quinone oxidoreductase [Aphanocapsa feldmannii 288cV]TGG92279.1 MAG: NAD(P)H-quinone oxidoreductase [Aphanocapsa feldmannii 277cV]TGH26438.1 MAG: NAD(P)H-quinone oxidoreductase [Aphanocapsa feldmannii 277cI]
MVADALSVMVKSTTRHIRIFSARLENGDLVPDPGQLTLDIDPDNEFIWNDTALSSLRQAFRDQVEHYAGRDLTEYHLRRIGSDLEGRIRAMLQAGTICYNPAARVQNYSMGLPRQPDNL